MSKKQENEIDRLSSLNNNLRAQVQYLQDEIGSFRRSSECHLRISTDLRNASQANQRAVDQARAEVAAALQTVKKLNLALQGAVAASSQLGQAVRDLTQS